MGINIRPFTPKALPALDALDHLMWLFIQYHEDYAPENAFCAWEDDALVGFGCFCYSAGWHAGEGYSLPRKLTVSLRAAEDLEDPDEVRAPLLDALIGRMQQLAQERPGQRVALGAFAEEDDGYLIQLLLEKGFTLDTCIPVLGWDLEEDIPEPVLPPGVAISLHDYRGDGFADYIAADAEASGDYPDSEAELRFRLGGPGFATFVAKAGDRIIGAASVWDIIGERAATENIFVAPDWRRQGIARALILTALRELKQRGRTLATLSVLGTNRGALALYMSLGYTYRFLLVEMLRMP